MTGDVLWNVAATDDLPVFITAPVDPLGYPVDVAFCPRRSTVDVDTIWHPATWVPGQTWVAGKEVQARVLIGPNGGVVTLEPARRYDVYVRIAADAATPIQSAGTLLTK